jgi:hypothetical protein
MPKTGAAPELFQHERKLDSIRKAHPYVIVEVSEQNGVRDCPAFRDPGSGESGLESLLQLPREYINVATLIVPMACAPGRVAP